MIEKDLLNAMEAALILMGVAKKNVKDWKACQKQFKNVQKLHEQMVALELVPPEGGARTLCMRRPRRPRTKLVVRPCIPDGSWCALTHRA